MLKFDGLLELTQNFKDEITCIKYLQLARWGNRIRCPHCTCDKVYKFRDQVRFKCAECRQLFTVKTRSIFENSNIQIRKWLFAIYFITGHKKGISSHQLAKDIKVTQKTAWFMLHRIRWGMSHGFFEKMIGGDDIVEIDETFVGGKNKNRHWNKKVTNSQGRSYKDKTPVMGMYERGGKLKFAVVCNTMRRTIQPIIKRNVLAGSKIMTDEWTAYRTLNKTYHHNYVNHGARQYVNGEVHTNCLEGFWSLLKRSIIGIYHQVSAKYLHLYVAECAFRYNTRKMKESSRMFLFLNNVKGKLSYRELVA